MLHTRYIPRRLPKDGSLIAQLTSVGLWVSGSHGLGEIACEIACNLMLRPGDEATSESHKCMDLSPVDRSSVDFFFFTANALFPTLSRLVAS